MNELLIGRDSVNARHNQTLPYSLNILNCSLFSVTQIFSEAFNPLFQSLILKLEKHKQAWLQVQGLFGNLFVYLGVFLFGQVCFFLYFPHKALIFLVPLE